MKNFLKIVFSLLVMGILYNTLTYNRDYTTVKSSVDNKEYLVRKLPDKLEAANKLAVISSELKQLIDSLDESEIEGISQLRENFDPENITENGPDGKYKAYSVNKGEQLSLCLRDAKTNEFIDKNLIYFIAIHELSHIMTDEIGHTPKFWNNMKFLLKEANKLNIYLPIDYNKTNVEYCGMLIKSTPYDFKK